MTRKLASRFAAALLSASVFGTLAVSSRLVRPAVAAPASPVGAVVMMPGTKVRGTVPYGERTFRPTDRQLSCIVVFHKPAPGTKVRTEWCFLDGKKELLFNEQDLVMGEDNARLFVFTINKPWPAGKYRVKVFVGGKYDRSITFNIK